MDEPTPPDSALSFSGRRDRVRAPAGLASLALVLEIALGLRVLAAGLVDFVVRRKGSDQLCLFPDTRYYWALGRMICSAATSEIVEWSDIPHFALRTPGYPLFLAACQVVFGERTLPVRLFQAVLGTVSVCLVYHLTRQFVATSELATPAKSTPLRWSIPMVAALIAAVAPYYVAASSLILSEAVFEPLMLTALLGLALLWNEPRSQTQSLPSNRKTWLIGLLIALGSGAAAGAAVLVRPSWAPFVPAVLVIWVVLKLGDPRARAVAIRGALVYTLGVIILMTPWWYRNMVIYGRFIPTALWMGASLYDGINPKATGTSEMSFLSDRDIWPLDEQDQDAELTRRAGAFTREQKVCVAKLALIKLARFWSPWPNADNLRSPALLVAAAVVELPFFGLMARRCLEPAT